jgi:hypothetical protein
MEIKPFLNLTVAIACKYKRTSAVQHKTTIPYTISSAGLRSRQVSKTLSLEETGVGKCSKYVCKLLHQTIFFKRFVTRGRPTMVWHSNTEISLCHSSWVCPNHKRPLEEGNNAFSWRHFRKYGYITRFKPGCSQDMKILTIKCLSDVHRMAMENGC